TPPRSQFGGSSANAKSQAVRAACASSICRNTVGAMFSRPPFCSTISAPYFAVSGRTQRSTGRSARRRQYDAAPLRAEFRLPGGPLRPFTPPISAALRRSESKANEPRPALDGRGGNVAAWPLISRCYKAVQDGKSCGGKFLRQSSTDAGETNQVEEFLRFFPNSPAMAGFWRHWTHFLKCRVLSCCYYLPPAGFEPTAPGLGILCSIHLSYGGGRVFVFYADRYGFARFATSPSINPESSSCFTQ